MILICSGKLRQQMPCPIFTLWVHDLYLHSMYLAFLRAIFLPRLQKKFCEVVLAKWWRLELLSQVGTLFKVRKSSTGLPLRVLSLPTAFSPMVVRESAIILY